MTGPPRLLQHPRPDVRDLLRAGIAERPSRGALQRTATALSVSAGVVSAAASASAGATLAAAAPSALIVVGKWLAIGTLAGVGLAAGAEALTTTAGDRPSSQPAPASAPSQTTLSVAEPAPATVAAETDEKTPEAASVPARPRVVIAERAERPPAALPIQALPSSADLPETQNLAREVAAIDGARAAIGAGDAAAAVRFLDDYASRPRTGTLEREAQLLRIDALLLQGKTTSARALARSYADSYPKDPRLSRFRALLEEP